MQMPVSQEDMKGDTKRLSQKDMEELGACSYDSKAAKAFANGKSSKMLAGIHKTPSSEFQQDLKMLVAAC